MRLSIVAPLALPLLLAGLACVNTPPATVTNCPSSYAVGYRVTRLGGVKAAIWYPSASPETTFAYSKDITSTLARDGAPQTSCSPFPLVLFAHGLSGCGTQSIFFTETLARRGYVVVAPDYRDALLCSVDGVPGLFGVGSQPAPILNPQAWTDASFVDRRDDSESVLNAALQDPTLQPMIDASRIGVAGHSLGGYTALGLAGGWANWKDSRIKAALLLSPYSLPFSAHATLAGVTVPVMYQGAEFDVGITPFVEGPKGAYAQSSPPKLFVKLRGGTHFTWTNAVCAGEPIIANCLQSRLPARLIDNYAIAFFDLYLKAIPQPLLGAANIQLADFQHQP
jgi:predicted dienelactone hydrolase